MHEHGNEMRKHDQIWWITKSPIKPSLTSFLIKKSVSQHMKIGADFVFCLCVMYEILCL